VLMDTKGGMTAVIRVLLLHGINPRTRTVRPEEEVHPVSRVAKLYSSFSNRRTWIFAGGAHHTCFSKKGH
jgi:L-arabinose isomerase